MVLFPSLIIANDPNTVLPSRMLFNFIGLNGENLVVTFLWRMVQVFTPTVYDILLNLNVVAALL